MDSFANRQFETKRKFKRIKIKGFTSYNVLLDGSNLSSYDRATRCLTLELGFDGSLSLTLRKTEESEIEVIRKINLHSSRDLPLDQR